MYQQMVYFLTLWMLTLGLYSVASIVLLVCAASCPGYVYVQLLIDLYHSSTTSPWPSVWKSAQCGDHNGVGRSCCTWLQGIRLSWKLSWFCIVSHAHFQWLWLALTKKISCNNRAIDTWGYVWSMFISVQNQHLSVIHHLLVSDSLNTDARLGFRALGLWPWCRRE